MPAIDTKASSIKLRTAHLVAKVHEYTNEHKELAKCHHFLFNLPKFGCDNVDDIRVVIIGQNPGITIHDKEDLKKNPSTPREETSGHDYREFDHMQGRCTGTMKVKSRKDLKWQRIISEMIPHDAFVQTERFFWSSSSLAEFRDLYRTAFNKSPHLVFCAEMNNRLIELYNPDLVLCLGLFGMKKAVELHRLNHVFTKPKPGAIKNIRLVEHYVDSESRPWLFIPNPTGSWGFSDADKKAISNYIASTRQKNY